MGKTYRNFGNGRRHGDAKRRNFGKSKARFRFDSRNY